MTRTTFKTDALSGYVTIRFEDDMGDIVIREFHTRGEYVYEGDKQVCERLARLGNTLTVGRGQQLVDVIRAEWRADKRAEARERARY